MQSKTVSGITNAIDKLLFFNMGIEKENLKIKANINLKCIKMANENEKN
jgi:hypothetical protein